MSDLRFAARLLLKDKGFTLVAAGVLAIGIAAVTTQFSIISATLFRGLPFPEPQDLYQFERSVPDNARVDSGIPAPDFEDFRAEQKSFEDLTGFLNGSTVNVLIGDEAKRYTGSYVTPSYFSVFRIRPAMGRTFTDAENQAGADRVCVISHGVWQRDFGGIPDVLGKSFRMNGRTATVIGVMGRDQAVLDQEEFWIPLYNEFDVRTRTAKADPRTSQFTLGVVGRLKAGVSLDQVQVEFNGLAKRLATAYPDTNKDFPEVKVKTMQESFFGDQFKGLMFVMFTCVVAVLLIACVNVMNMQFARTILRSRELAVRAALGASPWRVMRQMLLEGLLLSLTGALAGGLLGSWCIDLLWKANEALPNPLQPWLRFRLDTVALMLIGGCAVTSAVISTLLPAWLAVRANLHSALKDVGRGNTSSTANRLARAFVIVQISLTCVLLIATLFMVRSIHNQANVDLGYDPKAVLIARMALFDGDYPKAEDRRAFYDRTVRELRAQPAFAEVALTDRFRMMFSPFVQVRVDGVAYDRDKDVPGAIKQEVSDGFFKTVGLRLLEGRDFNADDRDEKQPIAIVNASFAKRFFPKGALGQRFRDGKVEENQPWRTIVGIVPDTLMQGPFDTKRDSVGFYTPFGTGVSNFMTIVVRPRVSGGDPLQLAPVLRQEMRKLDANLPLYFLSTPERTLNEFLAVNKLITLLFGAFGGIGVVLAAAGLYGVMGFSVNQRMGEFGIRLALGAATQHIVGLIYGQGGRQVAIGLGFGIAAAGAVLWTFRSGIGNFLFRVPLTDPLVFLGVAAVIALAAALACLFPALRASRVDPIVALRAE